MNKTDAFVVGLLSLITLIGGTILLSLAFDWKIGVGIACFVYYHKGIDYGRPS